MNNSLYSRPYFSKLEDVKSDDGKFIIPVSWQVYSTIRVEAENLQEALIRAQEHIDSILKSDKRSISLREDQNRKIFLENIR